MFGFDENNKAVSFESDNALEWRFTLNNSWGSFWRWQDWCGDHDQAVGYVKYASCTISTDSIDGEDPYTIEIRFDPALDAATRNYIRRWWEKESNIGFEEPDDGHVSFVLAEDVNDFEEALSIAENAILGYSVAWDWNYLVDDVYVK